MIIKSIFIKNFRSIVSEKIDANNVTIFVGNNDAGKSNVIKALNLFFNNKTDFNTSLNFDSDYSVFAPSRKKMAKEISITIELIPPESYKASKNIFWTKRWRKSGLVFNERKFLDNSSIDEERSRIGIWLDQIVFKYIPATKSDSYFQDLLGNLHDTLTSSFEGNLISASSDFTTKIQENTIEISNELSKRLQIFSTLQLPTNLRQLFQTLDFQTKLGEDNISLNNRGDGIKSRHIPIILKFISEQENKSRNQGAPRIATIWGYEEPENNLELRKSFELARDFYEYSTSIQMFITTHSPSFYGMKRLSDIFEMKVFNPNIINTFLIQNSSGPVPSSKVDAIDDNVAIIDDHIGLLPVITPYILEKKREIDELNERMKTLAIIQKEQNCPTIFVEGITDQKVYLKCIQLYSPSLHSLIEKKELRVATEKGAGVNWVSDSMRAWVYARKDIKIAGILDFDEAGIKCKVELERDCKCSSTMQNGKFKIVQLPKSEQLQQIFHKGIKLPLGLEEMYPIDVWEYANSMNYLEPRDNIHKLIKKLPTEKSPRNFLLEDLQIPNDICIYCVKKVKTDSKEDLVNQLLKLPLEELIVKFRNFTSVIMKLESFFISA